MRITIEQKSTTTVFQISGSLDVLSSDEAQIYLDSQMNNTQKKIVIDLSQLEYISSAGLRVLISVLKNTRIKGGDLYLAELQESVYQVIKLAGFANIFRIFPTVEAAASTFPS